MTARASSSNFERSCNSKLFQSWWSCQYRRLRCSTDLAARGAAPFLLMKFNQWRQRLNGGLAHYVIAAAAVASHNVKHAWVLAWVASRFAASSCHLRFSHFAIVLQSSWTKFFTKAKSQCLFRCTSRAIRYISISVYRLPLSSGPRFSRNVSVRGP